MTRKRSGVGGLILATVSIVVILAATLIINSRAAIHSAPSYGSLELPAESEFAPLSGSYSRSLPSRSSSSPAAANTHASAGGGDTSAQVGLPTGATKSGGSSATSDAVFEQLWYGQEYSAFAPIASDSSWPQSGASASGYGSSSNAAAYSRRSAASGGYGGASGGGFPSGGGGGAINPQRSNSDSSARAQVLSNAGTPASDGEVPSLLPAQAIANLPPGNPLLGTGPTVGVTFPFAPFGGTGPGGATGAGPGGATGAALPSVGAGSTAGVTALQQPVSVPEPSTVLLIGGGLALAAYRRRRRPTR